MRRFVFLLLAICTSSAFAQVVNTEKLRTNSKEQGLIFDADLDLGLTSNKAGQSFRYGFRSRIEYLTGKQKFLLFGGGNLTRFTSRSSGNTSNFVNRRFAHFRYNYFASSRITLEAFSQIQFDQIQLIRNRWLTGTGPRFKIYESDTATLYLGAIYMYEYEEEFMDTDEPRPTEIDTINRDHRLSAYASFAYAFTDYFTLNHITYYQPRLDNFSDFRISSETILNIAVSQKVSFKTFFQYIYDSEPPDPSVPRTMYSLTTGLGITL